MMAEALLPHLVNRAQNAHAIVLHTRCVLHVAEKLLLLGSIDIHKRGDERFATHIKVDPPHRQKVERLQRQTVVVRDDLESAKSDLIRIQDQCRTAAGVSACPPCKALVISVSQAAPPHARKDLLSRPVEVLLAIKRKDLLQAHRCLRNRRRETNATRRVPDDRSDGLKGS